jgi:anaerobic selenocysteine-containing dehydrogenase
MNAWLRQIHTKNPLYVPGPICDELDLVDGDWVFLISHHGRIKVEIVRMEAVNSSTIWTWNAIGKREGAWGLDRDAPEARKGFLMNHLINELLPPKGDGMRWSNSDPVTGQAAWYDLRVRIEKTEPAELSEPRFAPVSAPGQPGERPNELRYGQEWAK